MNDSTKSHLEGASLMLTKAKQHVEDTLSGNTDPLRGAHLAEMEINHARQHLAVMVEELKAEAENTQAEG
jgi:hypothetical protein